MVAGALNNPDSPMGIGAMCGEDFFTGLVDEVRTNNPIDSLEDICTQRDIHETFPSTERN